MKRQLLNGKIDGETMYGNIRPEHANGVFIYSESKKYHDLRSGLWNISLGYEDYIYKSVNQRFSDLLRLKIPYIDSFSYDNALYSEVTNQIDKLTNYDFSNIVFTNSGSENTELAIKINALYHKNNKKKKIIAFKGSYHGNFFGGMSVSGIDIFLNASLPLLSEDIIFIPFPENSYEEELVLHRINELADSTSMLIAEPVLGSAGVSFTSINFWNEVLSITEKNNILTLFDEVATGFYRTGSAFYYQNLKHVPDILSLSKGINNGINPFGALLFKENIKSKLSQEPIEHFSTQNGNLLGFVAANVVLDIYLKTGSEIKNKVKSIEKIINEKATQYHIEAHVIGAMASFPVHNINTTNLIDELTNKNLLTYYYSNDKSFGITIFPMYNENIEVFEKALDVLFKTILRYQ